MIELDRTLEPLCKLINECYEASFPGLPQFPKFSLTRAMITLWKHKVYAKLEGNLTEAFVTLLYKERQAEIKLGEQKTDLQKKGNLKTSKSVMVESGSKKPTEEEEGPKSLAVMEGFGESNESRECELLGRFVQSVADISVNELKIHYLGSTKVDMDEPYNELDKIVLKQTK